MDEAEFEEFHGSLAMFDISGFSTFASRLEQAATTPKDADAARTQTFARSVTKKASTENLVPFRKKHGTGEGAEGLTKALNEILGGFIDVICQVFLLGIIRMRSAYRPFWL
jgi:hypothetical protein